MKKYLKILSVICTAVLLLMVFTACGGKGSPSADTSTNTPSTESSKTDCSTSSDSSSKPVTLRFSWWGGDVRHKATLDAINLYKQKNPNITVEAEYQGSDGYQQKMMTQFAGGTAPDVIQIDQPWLNDLSQKDLLMDLSNNKGIDFSQFEEKIIKSFCTLNGKLLGLPTGSNGLTFIANKAFFQKYDIPLDSEFTWDSFIELGKKIHEQDKEAYLSTWDPSETIYFVEEYVRQKTGNYWINDDFTITASKDDLVEGFTKLKELYDSGTFLPLGEVQPFFCKMDQNPKWINGKIGGFTDWASKITTWKNSIKDEIVTLKAPVVKDGKANDILFRPAQLLSANNASANKEEAVRFINWFLNDKEAAATLKDVRSVPTSKISMQTLVDANAVDKDVVAAIKRTLSNPAPAAPFIYGDAEIGSILMDSFQKVIFNKQTPEQAADEVIKRTQAKLDALKAAK